MRAVRQAGRADADKHEVAFGEPSVRLGRNAEGTRGNSAFQERFQLRLRNRTLATAQKLDFRGVRFDAVDEMTLPEQAAGGGEADVPESEDTDLQIATPAALS